jgi:zinc transport system substrate-binding protein
MHYQQGKRSTWSATLAWLGLVLLCGSAGAADSGSLRVLTTFYPLHIHALNICRDMPGVEVRNLAPPETGCLHDYQLTPADMVAMARADVLVINGGGMESFVDEARPGLRVIDASIGIPLIEDEHGPNPHVWLSVLGAIRQVRNIADQLAAVDPSRAVAYRANADAYMDKLGRLRDRMLDELKPFRGQSIITFHEAFPYFAREFGLKIVAVVEQEPGSEPSARELADLIATVKKSGTRTLFVEPQYPTDAAETIARETGAKLLTLDPAVTGPVDPDAYIRTMEKNLETLRAAFSETTNGHE